MCIARRMLARCACMQPVNGTCSDVNPGRLVSTRLESWTRLLVAGTRPPCLGKARGAGAPDCQSSASRVLRHCEVETDLARTVGNRRGVAPDQHHRAPIAITCVNSRRMQQPGCASWLRWTEVPAADGAVRGSDFSIVCRLTTTRIEVTYVLHR